MRYAFNHDSDKLQEIFGLPDGYPQAVKKAVQHAAIDNAGTGAIMEDVLNRMKPKNTVEAAYIGYAVGTWIVLEYQKRAAISVVIASTNDAAENNED